MRSKPKKIEDEELDPYATERVNAVSDLFPDERLRKEFGLTIRECYFVRAYAVLHNAQRRARTRSPSPRAWRPDFPGAAREAP